MIYKDINKLPLYVFVDCLLDKKYNELIIEGTATDEELNSAWNDLLDQYVEAIGDEEHKLYFSLYREILLLEIKMQQVECGVKILERFFVKEIADVINDVLNTSFEFDFSDHVAYNKLLQRCLNRSKEFKLHLEIKRLEFKEFEKRNNNETDKPTRDYFLKILINISNVVKYQVTDRITVAEFCIRIKQLNDYLSHMEKLHKR